MGYFFIYHQIHQAIQVVFFATLLRKRSAPSPPLPGTSPPMPTYSPPPLPDSHQPTEVEAYRRSLKKKAPQPPPRKSKLIEAKVEADDGQVDITDGNENVNPKSSDSFRSKVSIFVFPDKNADTQDDNDNVDGPKEEAKIESDRVSINFIVS